ncbi:ABC transporter ATP-binding protein [Pelagibacterium lentulum]|uniref:ABC transporter domain-containing protein n=1 Tax=Pelagibacterium lentulum TaxID=2029865 RepID=A0A916RMA7_9HYPH|nr:ABC transporter ATP-binding protein [Pelagibacterium lentulum]GGA62498.1 hypothetical protein GCM10011499_36110 [Pelagibacterium lentulum]
MQSTSLTLDNVTVRMGQNTILDSISLSVPQGSFTCLLGPSGCGKTTLLRAIAGFAPLESGDMAIDAVSIAALPPEKRQTAMVFQSYALWPHMSVAENLAYPLKLRGIDRASRARKVARILDLLDLAEFGARSVASLSGGQRQRIALGRALVIDPPILLLDEPLSNLDAAIRRNLRSELRQLQRQLGITTIMVTHDQEEALSMADTIVLMRSGKIAQVAAPEALYAAPVDIDAARFMGVENFITTDSGEMGVASDAACFGFRSMSASICLHPLAGHLNRKAVVIDSAYAGDSYQVLVKSDGELFSARSSTPQLAGAQVILCVPADALIPFGADKNCLIPTDYRTPGRTLS